MAKERERVEIDKGGTSKKDLKDAHAHGGRVSTDREHAEDPKGNPIKK